MSGHEGGYFHARQMWEAWRNTPMILPASGEVNLGNAHYINSITELMTLSQRCHAYPGIGEDSFLKKQYHTRVLTHPECTAWSRLPSSWLADRLTQLLYWSDTIKSSEADNSLKGRKVAFSQMRKRVRIRISLFLRTTVLFLVTNGFHAWTRWRSHLPMPIQFPEMDRFVTRRRVKQSARTSNRSKMLDDDEKLGLWSKQRWAWDRFNR